MKRKLQTLFAVLLTLSLLTATASAKSFPDVDAGAWYSDAVEYMNELGVMVGDTEGNFNPDKTVTRAEMAAVICRTLEKTMSEEEYLPAYLETENFSDVPANHWANGYINKVSFLGIASGYGGGRFGPSDYLTYEQAVTMIVRMLGAETKANTRGGYPDGFLNVAEDMGLLSGIRAAKGERFSRANVAVLLSNYLHTALTDNPSDNSGEEITDATDTSGPDDQIGDTLEIEDSQPGDQPENAPGTGGTGGGT